MPQRISVKKIDILRTDTRIHTAHTAAQTGQITTRLPRLTIGLLRTNRHIARAAGAALVAIKPHAALLVRGGAVVVGRAAGAGLHHAAATITAELAVLGELRAFAALLTGAAVRIVGAVAIEEAAQALRLHGAGAAAVKAFWAADLVARALSVAATAVGGVHIGRGRVHVRHRRHVHIRDGRTHIHADAHVHGGRDGHIGRDHVHVLRRRGHVLGRVHVSARAVVQLPRRVILWR